MIWPVLQYLPSPAYEIQEAGEDGVQAERSEFIVRASESAMYRHKTEHLPVHLVKAKEAAEVLDASSLIEHLQALRVETLDVLAAAKEAKDNKTLLAAVARAEAQLRLAAEMLGALQSKLHVQVRVRGFMDLTEEELQFLVDEAERAQRLPAPAQE